MLMVCAAAEAAQYLATGQAPYADHVDGSRERGDRRAASIIDPTASWDEWIQRTKGFLHEPLVWRCVKAVARELDARGALNESELTAVILAVEPDRPSR